MKTHVAVSLLLLLLIPFAAFADEDADETETLGWGCARYRQLSPNERAGIPVPHQCQIIDEDGPGINSQSSQEFPQESTSTTDSTTDSLTSDAATETLAGEMVRFTLSLLLRIGVPLAPTP